MVTLSKIRGLIKHPRSRMFWFRRVVPKDLRGPDKLGKTEVKQSLDTSDLRIAERRAAVLWVRWSNRFDDLRYDREPGGLAPMTEDFADIAVWWRDLWDPADAISRSDGVVVDQKLGPDGKYIIQRRDHTPEELFEVERDRLEETEKKIYAGDLSDLRNTAVDILKEKGFRTDEKFVQQLISVLSNAERDAFEIQTRRRTARSALDLLERDKMEYVSSDLRLSQILDQYFDATKPREQTRMEWEMVFRRLQDVVGDKLVRKVSKSDIRTFREHIEKLPTRPSRTIQLLPVKDMIVEARRMDLATVSVETVRKHISAVRAVLEWAVDNELISSNPATKMAPKLRHKPDRRPFSHSDLRTIFDPKSYYGHAKTEADFWMPLVCLFSGARIEEISQLHLGDVISEDNVNAIEIAPQDSVGKNDSLKQVKTASSIRLVPVHPYLIDAGFMEFVRMRQTGFDVRLFDELDRDKIGRLGKQVSRRFIRYMRTRGITDTRKVFHSFRHTFKDACRNAGVYEDVHDRLTGHSNSSVGRSYGSGHSLVRLNQEIIKIQYPEVPQLVWNDFTDLKR